MKTSLIVMVTMVTYLVVSGFQYKQIEDNKIVAIYLGVNDDGLFEFKEENNEFLYFDAAVEDFESDLYDEFNLDKKFIITWEEELVLMNNDEDSEMEVVIYKTIINLEEVEEY